MSGPNAVDSIREELRAWAASEAARPSGRDNLVRRAVAAGLSDTAIHEESGISRTTIGQIRNPHGPLAIREAARRALRNRGITVPAIVTTKDGEVRLSLPQRRDHVERMNWTAAILTALTQAGIITTPSTEPHGSNLQEHLAHRNEQYVVLTTTGTSMITVPR